MGYYTSFEIGIKDMKQSTEILKVFLDEVPYGRYFEFFGKALKSLDCIKWYEHDEDMLAFSKKYPDIVFVLYGAGEESSDLWKEYYQNGKRQYAPVELSFPEFDPGKLK